jgi:cell division protein FtsI/penicillin-binding protein 2
MAKDYTLEKRKLVIGGVAIVIVIIYIMRLFVLQIMTDTYKKNADSNAFLNKSSILRAVRFMTAMESCWCSINLLMTSHSCRER